MKIGDRNIGLNHKPLFIAEIGINHNGSLKTAKEMVDSAIRAGVEIIKHQTHIPEFEMSKRIPSSVIPSHTKNSIYDIIESCSLSEEDEFELKKYVESKGIIFISTPFCLEAIDRLERFNIPCYKIGSGEMKNFPMLKKIAETKKPLIMSTGMHDIKDVQESVDFLFSVNKDLQLAILHTTNLYPTPDHLVRLGALVELASKFPDIPLGLSDHTLTNHSSFGAVCLGASIIEKHYTDRKDRVGPDIICSVDELECIDLLKGIEICYKQRGGQKNRIVEEENTRNFAFATATSLKIIKKGQVFSNENICLKRPNLGDFNSKNIMDLFGKISSRDIIEGEQILFKDVQN
jgi:N-acetylneuraminate synthase